MKNIFFVTVYLKNKVFVDRKLYINDPQSEHKEIRVVISNHYMGGKISMYPHGRRIYEVYDTNGQLIPPHLWTPVIKAQIKECKKDVKGVWKLYGFPIILVLFIMLVFGSQELMELYKKQVVAKQEALILDPKEKDLVFFYGYSPTDKVNNMHLSKIDKINEDTVFLQYSKQKQPIEGTQVGTADAVIETIKAEGINLTDRTIAIKKKEYLKGRIITYKKGELDFAQNGGYISKIER